MSNEQAVALYRSEAAKRPLPAILRSAMLSFADSTLRRPLDGHQGAYLVLPAPQAP